jgi:hypothetical protein
MILEIVGKAANLGSSRLPLAASLSAEPLPFVS